jgi:hypothetical protein
MFYKTPRFGEVFLFVQYNKINCHPDLKVRVIQNGIAKIKKVVTMLKSVI